MVNFAFDNGYGEAAAGNSNAPNEASNAAMQQPQDGPIIRKLSAMFDDLKDMFKSEQPTYPDPATAGTASDPVPEAKYTGSKTVTVEGVGAMTATISAQFHSATRCTFKCKCYDPDTLERRINTVGQSKRLIHKIGSIPFTSFKIEAGEWITLPMQAGENQGEMNMGCHLSGLKWDRENGNSIGVDISTTDDLRLSPKMSTLFKELFKEPIDLNPGTCREVLRFNTWLVQANTDILVYSNTPRMNP